MQITVEAQFLFYILIKTENKIPVLKILNYFFKQFLFGIQGRFNLKPFYKWMLSRSIVL